MTTWRLKVSDVTQSLWTGGMLLQSATSRSFYITVEKLLRCTQLFHSRLRGSEANYHILIYTPRYLSFFILLQAKKIQLVTFYLLSLW